MTGAEFIEMMRKELMGDFYNPNKSINHFYKKIKKYFVSKDYKKFSYKNYLCFVSLLNSYFPFEDNEKFVSKLLVNFMFKLRKTRKFKYGDRGLGKIDYEICVLLLKRFFEMQKKKWIYERQIELLITLCGFFDIDVKDIVTRFYKGELFDVLADIEAFLEEEEDSECEYED